MPSDLDEIKERIQFARDEATSVETKMRAFMRDAILILRQPNANGTFDLYTKLQKPIPVAVRAQAGTTANELRSCLDSLACVLAIRNQQDTKNTYFPASKSEAIFNDDGMRKIRNLSAADQAKIVAMRPFKGGMPGLFDLHEADRTRKHQRLAVCTTQQSPASIGAGVFGNVSNISMVNSIVNGVVIDNFTYRSDIEMTPGANPTIPFATGVPAVLPIDFEVRISFSEPEELKGADVVISLKRWADMVSNIVDQFA